MTEENTPKPENTESTAPEAADVPTPEVAAEAPAEPTPEVAAEAPAEPTPEVAAEAPAEPEAKPAIPVPAAGPDPQGWWRGTGRRKTAVARVRIKPGEGEFIVNKRPLDEFFKEERDRNDLNEVLMKTSTHGSVDVHVRVNGGGFTGQAGAIILGLGRALRNYDISLDSTLRKNGYLSRDPRKVERKKPGQPGARKRFQFSKR